MAGQQASATSLNALLGLGGDVGKFLGMGTGGGGTIGGSLFTGLKSMFG
jgi:hypothetical protein